MSCARCLVLARVLDTRASVLETHGNVLETHWSVLNTPSRPQVAKARVDAARMGEEVKKDTAAQVHTSYALALDLAP